MEIEIVRQGFGLERFAVVRAVEHARYLRRYATVRQNSGRAYGARASGSRGGGDVQERAKRKSVHRLEPELGLQDHGFRLFIAGRERGAAGVDASELERTEGGDFERRCRSVEISTGRSVSPG